MVYTIFSRGHIGVSELPEQTIVAPVLRVHKEADDREDVLFIEDDVTVRVLLLGALRDDLIHAVQELANRDEALFIEGPAEVFSCHIISFLTVLSVAQQVDIDSFLHVGFDVFVGDIPVDVIEMDERSLAATILLEHLGDVELLVVHS